MLPLAKRVFAGHTGYGRPAEQTNVVTHSDVSNRQRYTSKRLLSWRFKDRAVLG